MHNGLTKLAEIKQEGSDTFGTGGHNTSQFNAFYRVFRQLFTQELVKLKAENIKFHKGHFYLSGFFSVDGKWFYFSMSDVRYFPENDLLVRTAKDDKDYTGGLNTYHKIENNMYLSIKSKFNL